ncbi:DUF2971 domain-containing protein [Tsukamurella tyrosinosolvens]|uniref:DUF2971 domain-containing protein n=1 Tax=Tsukamurella tyrosinosolvens TaxID=57704 RepID=UPI003F49DEF2
MSVDDEIPDVLSHYTSARGLMGILGARQYPAGKGLQPSVRLWATDSQYLNDSHEVLWGAAGIIKAAEDAPGEADGLTDMLVKMARLVLAGHAEGHRVFVTSLSRTPDLLSQWRAYAQSGYSIQLATDALQGLEYHHSLTDATKAPMMKARHDEVQVRSVRYPKATDNEFFADLLQVARRNAPFQAAELPRLLATVKNDSFKEEEEVRLILASYSGSDARWTREGAGGLLVPYVELESATPQHAASLVQSITIAPCSDFKRRRFSLRRFLEQQGFGSDIPIHQSSSTLQ